MLLLLFHLVLGFQKDKDSILMCYSEKTPLKLLELFSEFTQSLNLSSNSIDPQALMIKTVFIIIDITKDPSLYSMLDQLSQQFNTFYISITHSSGETSSSLRFHLHPSQSQQENAILALLEYLNWKEFSLFGSSQINDQLLANSLRSKANHFLKSFFVYENDLTEIKSDMIVRKLIKTQGVKNLLVIDDGDSLNAFQKSLKFRKIPKFGTYLVFINRGIYTVDIEGALIISEPGTESSVSEETFEFLTISNFVQSLEVISLENLKKKCPNQVCFKSFNLVNIKQGIKKIIGKIENKIELTEVPVFPENNTSILSETKKSKIVLSIANGTSEIFNQGYFPAFAYWYEGARYSVSRSNLLKEFKDFELDLFPTDCGNMIYDENWYKICLGSVLDNLGVAYLTSIWGDGAKGNLLTLRALSKQIPQISPLALLDELENKTAYPELLKFGIEIDVYALAILRFMRVLNWKDIIIFASEEEINLYIVKFAIDFFGKAQVNIINPSNLRIFPLNYSRESFDQYKEYFEFAKKSRCRVYLIFSSRIKYIIEGLYDIGLRKGDFILFGEVTVLNILNDVDEPKYKKKLNELLAGSLVGRYKEWDGKLGNQLKEELSNLFDDITYMCLTYDTVSVVKNALEYLIALGEDFEDQGTLGKAMRSRKFVGCLGNIYFKSDSNIRASFLIFYGQIVYNKKTGKYTLQDFAEVNPYSSKLIQFEENILWATGEKTIPTNYIEYSKCGFDDRLVVKSENGQSILFIISSVLVLISIICAFVSWKSYNYSYKELKENKEMNLNDYIFILFFIIEFFEIISLGPKNGIISFSLNKTELLLAIDITSYFDFTFDKFWALYVIVLIIVYVFTFMSLTMLFIREELMEKYFFLNKFKDLSHVTLPLIGHIGFLPLISLLLDILICEEGIGKELEESYLERDCSQFCYKGKHKVYSIGGILALVFFISVGSFLRPYWEIVQNSLNLSTQTWYLSVLSVFQTLFVICRKSLKVYNESIPGFIICFLIGILILITAIKKPYNYMRVVIYQITSLTMSLWALLISSIYVIRKEFSIIIPILFIGLLVILGIGLVVSSKYQKIFKSDDFNPIPGLIRFQFTGKIEYLKAKDNNIIEEKKEFSEHIEN